MRFVLSVQRYEIIHYLCFSVMNYLMSDAFFYDNKSKNGGGRINSHVFARVGEDILSMR